MHHLTPPLHFAGIMGLGVSELVVIVAILGVMIAVPIAIIAIWFSFRHRQQTLWHDNARLALEKGQPLPVPPNGLAPSPGNATRERNDIRTGLILIGIGAGLSLFFASMRAREGIGLGAIPACIGVALLCHGLFSHKKSPAKDFPPRS